MGIIKKYELGRIEIVFIVLVLAAVLAAGVYVWRLDQNKKSDIRSFADCIAAGNETLDSFPEQCRANGQTFYNITNFEQCKAAGFPVQESYPERCAANGETFTNTAQQPLTDPNAQAMDEEAIITAITTYCAANGPADIPAITNQLKTNMQDTNLYVNKDGFARLSATCGDGGFRAFLLRTEDSEITWKFIVGTQEETAACTALDGLGFPPEVVSQCYDENGDLRAIKPAA